MIARVAGPSVSLMIGIAAFFTVFGLVDWWHFGHRKHQRYMGRMLLTGIPGLYLAGLASMGETKWLYIPGLGLMGSACLMQILGWRHDRPDEDAAPPRSGGSPSHEKRP